MSKQLMRRTLAAIAAGILIAAAAACSPPAGADAARTEEIARRVDQLNTRDWDKAVDALVRLGRPAVAPLVAALERTERFIPGRAAIALARIHTKKAVEAVYRAWEMPGIQVKTDLVTALGDLGTARAEDILIGVVKDPSVWQLQQAAARALGKRASKKGLEAVAGLLDSEAWYNRVAAVQVLGKSRSARAVPALLRSLSDESRVVAIEGRKALAEVGRPAAPALVAALPKAGEKIRWQIVWALGRIDSPRAVDPLLSALGSADRMERSEAAVSLVRFEDGSLDARLRKIVEGTDRGAAEEAAWVLSQRAERAAAEKPRPEDAPAAASAGTEQEPPASPATISYEGKTYPVYPATVASKPPLPSPLILPDGSEYVLAGTAANAWAVFPVSPESVGPAGKRQRDVDAADFPALAAKGLHAEDELARARSITGRSIAEVTDLGRPGALSTEGFMAEDEDILSVLAADNRRVARLGLSHPQLARPLFHVWNMILTDTRLGRWNMAAHRWENIVSLLSHGKTVLLEAGDTKGGQESIFADGLEGGFWINIRREPTADEEAFLWKRYGHLPAEAFAALKDRLTRFATGEMEPYYIKWYGFYEGHTSWRTDPLAIAFIFGLRSLAEIDAACPEGLDKALFTRFIREAK